MFGKFSEQMTMSAQPVANLLEMNAKALGMMAEQQTLLFTGLMTDSVKLVKNLSDQTELNGVLAAQSVFAESLRERITGASKTTYKELNGIHAELLKEGVSTVEKIQAAAVPATKATTASAPNKASTNNSAKTAPVKKAVAKKAPVKKSLAASAPANKPAAAVNTKTATVENKEVNKIATSNAPKAVTTESKVADKPVAKTVTKTTPADVKASV